ncbi:MAG: GMC family oxidoreductase [Acidobacteriaceae bacterium]|nr:GMC family oxidoreductase [Acidobacteriaceae bacterium]
MASVKRWIGAAAIAVVASANSAAAAGTAVADASLDSSLRAVHNALFASFLPIDELPDDPHTAVLLKTAREDIWQEAAKTSALQELLGSFADLRGFGNSCGIANAIKGAGSGSFAVLSREKRAEVLRLLQNCDAVEPRHLAATVRNFYIVKGYGAVQGELTGVKLDLFAPAEYVKSHMPHLAPTRLVYDSGKKELVESDGHAIDVLIVGSGPAGSVLAHELRRNGRRVLLVERGSFVVPGSMETRLIDDLIDTRTSMDGAIRIRNGMGVGGGSQVNVDLCFAPISDAIRTKIESWRKAGRIAADEFTQPELAREYEWVKRTIGTRTLREQEINRNNRALWEGAKLSGLHPKLYSLNTYAPGTSPSPVTDKRSAESELLIPAVEDRTNPVGLLPDADVRRVLFRRDGESLRAIGVEVAMRSTIPEAGAIADPNNLKLHAGEPVTIHARTVILSAGALGSPTILLRSGVKNDQIGRGIVLHPSMPIMGRFDHHIDVLTGTEASVYVDDHLTDRGYALESMADQPLYAAIMSPGPARHSYEMIKAFRDLAGFGVMLVDTPQPSNRIVLDGNGAPQIDYTLCDADKGRFARGVAEAVRVMFKAGAKEVYLPTTEDILGGQSEAADIRPQILRSADQASLVEKNLKFISGRTMITSAHMQGTDKMGATPESSVVAQDFHVWGTRGLYVVDGSIFPTSVGANPMQSIYTIAKIFADHCKED